MIKPCKKCRREGEKLSLKGERCLSAKCAIIKHPYAPGEHGQGFHGKMSEYGKQLREKQKARRIYNMGEVQFSNSVSRATKMTGNKSENLMRILESRLDNIVYRAGFASSRSLAKQLVTHGLFTVNGTRATVPSIAIKEGDIVKPKKASTFKEITAGNSVSWLNVDTKKFEIQVTHMPLREEIDTPVNESLIIEFYSR